MSNRLFEALRDDQLLALCIYGEARGESIEGKIAVASVIMNRVEHPRWWGRHLRGVILRPWQFSCFNEADPNFKYLKQMAGSFKFNLDYSPALKECFWVAQGILNNSLRSNVGDATHYHTLKVTPSWRMKLRMIKTLGSHIFYTAVK